LGAFASTFALTISNPMTILTFIGLVAGLGASGAGDPSGPYRLVLGIFVGSALWWLFLVHVALAARSRLTAATTRWLDLASGLVLLVWGLSIAAGAL
jgi:threonine/homoserine/homoserine lactone efflux protein